VVILIFFLAIGIVMGYIGLIPESYLKLLKKIPYVCLLIILFFMGSKIGLDASIINNIKVIGWKALIIALGSIFGSLAFIRFIMGNTDILVESEEIQE